MQIKQITNEVEALGTVRTKKRYMSQGAVEPLFGVTIKDLKPIALRLLKLENCQQIAYELFDTGNYDLMYLAGMIVNPDKMSESKYDEWMDKSYFYMISDFIVSICLSETDFAEKIADRWIKSGDDLYMSTGYLTYCWMIANKKDELLNKEKLKLMMNNIVDNIHKAPNRTRYAMNYFLYNLGVSYLPLHGEALDAAAIIGGVNIVDAKGKVSVYKAKDAIEKEVNKGRLGFKRKNVRC